MKVLILGAAGAMAEVVIRDLLEFVPDVQITAADARELSHPDPRVAWSPADVRDVSGTSDLAKNHDVLINCVTYYLNMEVMQAALRARVPYVDLGGLYHLTKKQFELHSAFVDANVTAILGMGSTPGITNVMAGNLAKMMDTVSELHVRVGCYDESASGPLPVPYALDTVLDEFSLEPMLFRNGQALAVPPMSGEEEIQFPHPAGRMKAIHTLHSEVAMFPRSFPNLKEASFKVAFPPDFTEKVRFLVELGFASREKLVYDASPREMLLRVASLQEQPEGEPNDCDVLQILARGNKNGRKVTGFAETIILPHQEWRMAAGSLDTGVPISIVGQMLARKEISTPGVLCPELHVPADQFFSELQKRGISARFEIT